VIHTLIGDNISPEYPDMTNTCSEINIVESPVIKSPLIEETVLPRFFLFVILLLFLPAAYTEELTILTEEMPPYNYTDENNVVTGFSTEIVRELVKRTKLDITNNQITSHPWARAYKMLEKGPNVLLFSMTRSEEREKRFKWVGPIASRTIWFWKLKSRTDINATSLETIKKYRVGAVREFSSTRYMQELGFTLDLTNSEEINFKKFIYGRFDLLTALELAAAYHMNKQDKSFEQLERVFKLDDRYDYYLALNINTSDEIVNTLQNELDAMKRDGSYENIKQLYLK